MGDESVLLPRGYVIAGRYEIEARLGEGGMAVVYRARHTGTDAPVALKFIHPRLVRDRKLVEQFLQEARIVGKLGSNPHIVTVFDTGLDGTQGIPFIAMELLTGQTLRELIAERAPVPWDLAQVLLEQLADALDDAHQAGVVHRDLKPGNVFVSSDRRGRHQVKVLDFGIAKVLDGTGDGTATEVGTPWYNAPEQLGGGMRKLAAERGITIAPNVSASTDVWAFGLIAYELLLGQRVKQYWGAATVSDQMLRVALDVREPPTTRAGDKAAHLPAGFDEWFLCCMRHNAAERWRSAGEALAQLSTLFAPQVAPSAPGSWTGTPGPRTSQPSWASAAPPPGPDGSGAFAPAAGSPSDAWVAPPGDAPSAPAPSVPAELDSGSEIPTGPTERLPPRGAVGMVGGAPALPPLELDGARPSGPLPISEVAPIDTAQSWHHTLGRHPRRTRVAIGIGAACLLFGMIGGGALLWPAGAEPEPTDTSAEVAAPPAADEPQFGAQVEGDGLASTDAGPDGSTEPAASAEPDRPVTRPESSPPRPAPRRPAARPRSTSSSKPGGDPFGRSQK